MSMRSEHMPMIGRHRTDKEIEDEMNSMGYVPNSPASINIDNLTIKDIKALGKEHSKENLDLLLRCFDCSEDADIDVRREIVSSIGRQEDLNTIYDFVEKQALYKQNPMELIYQMYRTCLYKQKIDNRFKELGQRILDYYQNEMLYKMQEYYEYRAQRNRHKQAKLIQTPLLLESDAKDTLQQLPEQSVQLVFTSPP